MSIGQVQASQVIPSNNPNPFKDPSITVKDRIDPEKQDTTATQSPHGIDPFKQDDSLKLSTARPVSPIIKMSGGAFTGIMIGGATSGALWGAANLFLDKGSSLAAASKFGAASGAVSGFVSGAIIANMTDSKLEATLYSALAGAGTGAAIGGATFKNLPAALISGGIGAVSGAVSGFTTSHLLGN